MSESPTSRGVAQPTLFFVPVTEKLLKSSLEEKFENQNNMSCTAVLRVAERESKVTAAVARVSCYSGVTLPTCHLPRMLGT